jgi:myo-inositol-1(or 4)-monophosphatase
MFCVSIAFIYKSKPTVGVINAPMLNKSYHALAGNGAYITDLHTNKSQQLPFVKSALPATAPKGCTFSCEWGKDRRYTPEGNLWRKTESFINMAGELGGRGGKGGMVHGVRSLGRQVPKPAVYSSVP